MTCLHKLEAHMCPYCADVRRRLEPVSDERRGILEYLDWTLSLGEQLDNVLTREQQEGVIYATAWIRNQLDLQMTRWWVSVRGSTTYTILKAATPGRALKMGAEQLKRPIEDLECDEF